MDRPSTSPCPRSPDSGSEVVSRPVGFRAFARRRRRVWLTLGSLCAVVAVARPGLGADEGDPDVSLRATLAQRGLTMEPEAVAWIGDGGVLQPQGVVFVASDGGAPRDVYFALARVTGGGAVLDLTWLTNLTRSPGADDQRLVQSGHYAAYVSEVRGRYEAVTVLDLRGEPAEATRGWSTLSKVQNRITNVQESGRAAGFGRRRYALKYSPASLDLALEGQRFVLRSDVGTVVLDPSRVPPESGAALVEVRPAEKAIPGTITWVVDTVRNLSFVGPEPIEWLEHRVFSVVDAYDRVKHAFFGSTTEDQEDAVAEDLGVSAEERRRRIEVSVTDPELGLPPAPMDTVYRRALAGEGEWLPVRDDPFVQSFPNTPTPFYTTFLRPDPERSFARVYIALWDPRLVQLRMVAGTREPESATGETGSGLVPRRPETLSRLVAGFNGGFQALHGEFGMMASGRVYLPPKPWAATVAVRRDGTVAIGSWMDPPEGVTDYEESWAVAQIPDDIVDFRQNLTSMVEDERYNPWERWWWGAAPLNAEEQVHIDRSGLCLTKEGFFAYFWGESLGPEVLGEAMLRARCVRGLHLDMNSRHTGFEFYNAQPAEVERPPLEGRLGRKRYQGRMPLAPDWTLRSRLLVRSMSPMRFPRYAARDPRDFFYLTLKAVLPGPDVVLSDGSSVAFDTQGLPHAGFPYSFARAHLGDSPEAGTWIVRIDPNRVVHPALEGEEDPERSTESLAYLTGAAGSGGGGFGWFAESGEVGYRHAVGSVSDGGTMLVSGTRLSPTSSSRAALGIDSEGFVVYAERSADDPISLLERLRSVGVAAAVGLPESVRLVFAVGDTAVDVDSYEASFDREEALPLNAPTRPPSAILFPETQPRPYSAWARMQDTRVRYFREGTPTFSQSSGGVRDEADAGVE